MTIEGSTPARYRRPIAWLYLVAVVVGMIAFVGNYLVK
jgi:hypothetical protein